MAKKESKKILKEISALPVWQPYAWLIVNGYKDIENRDWEKPPSEERIGRRFAIYATKRCIKKSEYQNFMKTVKDQKIKKYPKSIDDFEYGMIVGTAILDSYGRGIKSYWAQRGLLNLKLRSARKIKPKKLTRGRQWWFTVKI